MVLYVVQTLHDDLGCMLEAFIVTAFHNVAVNVDIEENKEFIVTFLLLVFLFIIIKLPFKFFCYEIISRVTH